MAYFEDFLHFLPILFGTLLDKIMFWMEDVARTYPP